MRKITALASQAFINRYRFKRGNMLATPATYELHGHVIAWRENMGSEGEYIALSDCGYRTVTTKDRLNGLLQALGINSHIYQRAFTWYVDGMEWSGKAKIVNGQVIPL